ncbi:hypothetical protein CWI38_0035p0070 [Hamiltosporidium tvaerminnensis]|uniref:Uncharacterized protein n=2 Tax=Hamiltosporidium TaxID=1176354 RepID=A0A4Q9M1S6_9MICR|nr:hypothetical protein CWI38_0035p0070 [Hamiltosporidium tvaerminnensis]
MQNSRLDIIPSPTTPLPSSVEVSACEQSMPRMARKLHKYNCEKKLAQSEMGKEVKSEENGERRRNATFSLIHAPCPTRQKHPNKLVDSKVLGLINRVVGECAGNHVPYSITETAYIRQAAQVCYDEATQENIESKISKLLFPSETKRFKKIMREFNLNLSSVTDLSEALVKKNESLNVYEKKITMHESRKQFRKENRMFELFRGRFYRGLSERVKSEIVVSSDEIVSFWSTMLNKNTDTVTYENYLIPFVSDNHPTMFLLLDEFEALLQNNTCIFNLYKLTTKCVTKVLAENKLVTVRDQTYKDLKDFANFSKLDDVVRTSSPRIKDLASEHMLPRLLDCLEKGKETSTRRAAILKVKNNNKTHLSYRLVEEVTKKSLEEAQLAKLYNEVETRKLHSKLYNARKNELLSISDSSRWLKRGDIRLRSEAVFCYIQDRNVFWGADGHDYTRLNNEVVRYLHIVLLSKYKFKSSKRIRSHPEQEIIDNEYAEIGVYTRIKTDVKIRNNRPDIFILDKKKNKITLIEVGITSKDSLQVAETEKLRKYDLLANDLGLIYKCSVEIIPYVMTWHGIMTKYHKSHLKRLEIPMNLEAYIQAIVLKKTVETISFDRRRGLESGLNAEERWERASMGVIMRAEMHEEPTPPLKEEKREEDGAKNFKPKNKAPFISQRGTTLEEPTNNINKESDLEE